MKITYNGIEEIVSSLDLQNPDLVLEILNRMIEKSGISEYRKWMLTTLGYMFIDPSLYQTLINVHLFPQEQEMPTFWEDYANYIY